MSSIIFNCEFCKYQTNKKYNLNHHITTKHKEEEIKEEEIKEEEEEIYNCDKNYKTNKYFNNHQKICNGLNVLSCSKCMFIFTSRFSKSKHIKKNNCIAKSIINIKQQHITINNNKNENNNKEFIYLLQEREFIKTKEPIYKIGKTKQEKLKRIKSYPNGSELLFYIICNNCDEIEKTIINKFKIHFNHKKEFGNEYFMGNYNLMIDIIYNIIRTTDNEANENKNNDNNICSKCNKFYKIKQYLISHQSKCNGLNILSCPKCMSSFTSTSNKNRHINKNNCQFKSIIMKDDYINNYGNERIDYLEDFINKDNIKDLPIHKKLIKYIEYKNFNDEFPENRNIKYENNNCLIKEDGKWKSKDLNNLIIDIIEKNKFIVYNNYIEYIDEKDIDDKYIKNELKVLIKSSKSI
jgi:uncharacterized C2H2 Zn-finger protein